MLGVTGLLVGGRTPLEMVTESDPPAGPVEVTVMVAEEVSVTGQTVVETGMTMVETGQLLMPGPQLQMVDSLVV